METIDSPDSTNYTDSPDSIYSIDSSTLKIDYYASNLFDEYCKHSDLRSDEITSLELDMCSCQQSGKPVLFFSDLLLVIMQNNPNLKKIKAERYGKFCSEPPEPGFFYKFTDLVEEYKETGQAYPFFANIEEMYFYECSFTELDLQVLASSLFPNLKKVYCYYCEPQDLWIRDKYRDFLPFLDWDNKFEFDVPPNVKNSEFYFGFEDTRDYSNGCRPGYYRTSS